MDPSTFCIAGIKYNCSEQAFMDFKAIQFNDVITSDLIRKASHPKDQKAFGRQIKNFNDVILNTCKEAHMKTALYAKFAQNDVLRNKLIETGDKILVEASPFDAIWGIKMSETDPDILDESKWKGLNLLGKCLMEVRMEMIY